MARNARGRAPASASRASERSRNTSYGSAGRNRGSPPLRGSDVARRAGAGSVRSAYSLTPVMGAVRRAAASARRSRTSATRSATRPASSAAITPPAASISWKNAHAAAASSRVRDSTNHEPPAGSITRARWASCTSRAWVLRAIRRENGPDAPSAASKGDTVTASAPPTPAAKPATVPRSRLPYTSRRVSIAGEPTACWYCGSGSPQASVTRDHSRRAARSFAIVGNCSAVAA